MPNREELPAQCPPEAAEEIAVEREVFRVVKSDPPTDGDFRSQRAMRPGAIFHGTPECLARGCSSFGARGDGEKALKLPGLRGGILPTRPIREPMSPSYNSLNSGPSVSGVSRRLQPKENPSGLATEGVSAGKPFRIGPSPQGREVGEKSHFPCMSQSQK
jgi:hypothetical protein